MEKKELRFCREKCCIRRIIMTEREKMLAGLLYDCGDEELLARWHKAKNLMRDYNLTDSEDMERKNRILEELLGGRGKNLWITGTIFFSGITVK